VVAVGPVVVSAAVVIGPAVVPVVVVMVDVVIVDEELVDAAPATDKNRVLTIADITVASNKRCAVSKNTNEQIREH